MSKSRNSHPKRHVESSNHERSTTKPLDLQSSNEKASMEVPDIDERFVQPRHFVQYKPLCTFIDFGELNGATSDDSVTKEEWDQRMEYLLDDLHWLLKLPHNKFWSQVLYDDTLHHCLDSFLAYAPRDFDLSSCTEEDVLVTSQRVHKLIFFVFLRMSTYKESKKSSLSPEAFGEMIYENYLFDIPKLLDLCGLYGSKNGTILKKMIFNIFNTQPKYISDLETAVPHLFMVFSRVLGKLHLSQGNEEMIPAKLDEDISLGISRIPLSVLLDVVYYITDTAYALNAFIEIYPQSCHVYYRNEAATRVATFYDTVFPPIENELQTRENEETKTILEKYKSMVQLAKTLLLKVFRNFITTCCLQLIVESQCNKTGGMEELAFSHLEEYMCIFTEVVAHRHFIHDYNNMFPFENDIEMISEIGLSFDPTRLDYIFSSIHQYSDDAVCNGGLSLANKLSEESQKSYRHSTRKQNDVKDLQSLAATLTNGTLSSKNSEADLLSYEAAAASGIDEAELESLIAAVLDVLPGFGAGFIEACLKYYSFDSERVIDVLLQDSLPESLEILDRGLQRIPVPKDEQTPSLLSERRNVYDNDEFDIFNRKDVDMQRIHLGKKNKTPDVYQGLSDDKSDISDILKQISLCAATSQEEEEEASFPKEPDLYEDEYDDTYDSTTVGLMELQTEKELQNIRPFTTPRVLEQIKGSPQNIKDDDVEEEEEEEEDQPPPPKKDEFVANPAVLREMAEQRRQSQARNRRPHHPRENSQGQGAQGGQQHNRHHKEKHKGQVANHNRRRQADNKRSRGMGALPTR